MPRRAGLVRSICVMALASLFLPLAAAPLRVKLGEKAVFKILSVRDGLPNSSISGVLQDSKGFIWMATQGGLVRYDGSGFKSFTNEPFDENSISSDLLQTLFLDSGDVLWIGSYNGLNRMDTSTQTVRRYRYSADNESSLSNDLVIAVARDERGSLWVGTLNGLNRLDEKTGKFKRYFHDPGDPASIPNNTIRALFRDREGRLWVGTTDGGLAEYDYERDSFENYPRRGGKGGPPPSPSIQCIAQDADGRLWLGAWGAGLVRFSPADGSYELFSLPDNRIYSINTQVSGEVYVGTWGGGLFILEPASGTVESYKTSGAFGVLPNDVVYCIFRDASGELWVGTNGGGVARMERGRRSFTAYVADPSDPDALPAGKTIVTFVDSSDSLWASIYGSGLSRLDAASGKWKHFRRRAGDPRSLADDICNCLYEDSSGRLWAGTNDGLSLFDPKNSSFTTYRHTDGDPNSLGSSIVNAVLGDASSNLWIGTYTTGLDFWNRAAGVWSHYPYDPKDAFSISDNLVNCLAFDASGRLWVGTNNGLCRLENVSASGGAGGRFTRYLYDPEKKNGISSNSILRIYKDSKGVLWIATRGGGVMRYRAETDSFDHFTRREGLPNNIAYTVLEDSSSNIWIVTATGLALYDRQSGVIKPVALYNELENSFFNMGSSAGLNGELYFGSVGMITRFDPLRYEANTHVPPVFVTNVRAANEEKLEAPASKDEASGPLRLARFENSVEFRFAALDFRDPSANQFAVKLEGFDKDWRFIAGRNYATYTNLPGGRYTFRVKAANNDGIWNEEGASLGLDVASSPFLSLPAIILYLFAIAISGYMLATARANRVLAQKVREISAAHTALEVANKAKSEFVSTISHEVRTPLNGIIGMIDLLSRTRLDGTQAEYMTTIRRSGETLLSVINGVLDFSKLDAERVELEDIAFDPREMLERAIAQFAYQTRSKGIGLDLSVSDQVPSFLRGDPFRLGQVVSNLVGNAIKFTDVGYVRVKLSLGEGAAPGDGAALERAVPLVLEVSDTGIGIRKDKLGSLFQPFVQADQSTTRRYGGSGLGLAIVKRLIELMGGSIEARSEEGSGSDFIARFTLREAEAPLEVLHAGGRAESELARRVLVVDDDPVNRRVAAGLLRELGFGVVEAESGPEAIAQLSRESADFVLMDCSMPGMDGFEATSRIRRGDAGKAAASMPILAMTASSQTADRDRAMASGMSGSVAKPVTSASLSAALDRFAPAPTPQSSSDRDDEVFDAPSFRARYEGDEALGREILELYLKEAGPLFEEACAAAAAGDNKTALARIHRLKGTTGTIGGMHASEAAQAILASTSPIETLRPELRALEAEVRRYLYGKS